MIEKKFTMLSTKEWLQLFQYKLSPEREKELHERTNHDPFLKEAVETITTQDNRPIAFQSIAYLINQVEDATGVSESNIVIGRMDSSYNAGSSLSAKTLWMILAGVVLVALLASGIYYYMNLPNSELTSDDLVEVDSASSSQYIDTSNRPLDVIPNMQTSPDTIPTTISNPVKAASNSKKPSANNSSSSPSTSNPVSTSTAVEHRASSTEGNRERELFQQAQDKFKANDREGAKQILNNLKSYDNPMKNQAEKILQNMDGNQ